MNTMGFHGSDHFGEDIKHNKDNNLGFLAGIVGGIYQYFMNIHLDVDFWSKLLESAVTAGICGFVGMAGKEVCVVLRDSIKDFFRTKRSKEKDP